MKKQKTLYLGLLSLCLLAVLLFAAPVKAQAASFKQCGRTVKTGKYYIWTDSRSNSLRVSTSKSGSGSVLVSAASGRYLTYSCLSDGATVYYVERGTYDSKGNYTGYVCKIKTNGTGQATLGRLKNALHPTAYYKGSLYLDCYDTTDATLIHTYRMAVNTGKTKRTMKNASVMGQNGRYLLAMPNSGAVGPRRLSVYDCKKGKATTITKKAGSANFSGKKIYYSEYVAGEYSSSSTFRIRSCSLSAKSKKTVVKKIKATNTGMLTSKYAYYITSDSRGKIKYYRYDIKKKKAAKIKSSKYLA